MAEPNEAGTFETRQDAGQGGKGVFRLWKTALDLADRTEKDWRELAINAGKRYRDEERSEAYRKKTGKFNILYSTMETQSPAVYNSTPIPDVRRRFNDEDPVGKTASQAFERSLSHCTDEYDFDDVMESAVHDSLLRGRGLSLVVYEPTPSADGDGVDYETVRTEHVQWDDFRRGPAKKWEDVPWAAIRYRITREDATELNKKVGPTVDLDHIEKEHDKDGKDVPDVFKRLTVWKIWDKIKREIVFIAPSYKEGPFAVSPDELGLRGFFPFPRPVYDIPDTSSLIPIVPYEMYRDQAEELDRVSARIKILVNCLKWRGIRPSQIEELDRLKDALDGELIPSESAAAVLAMSTTGGDMNKAIWLMPIEKLIAVIRELVIHRETIKQVIFEITGIADILRGETDPGETLGAQQLKAQWGSLRMQKRQREVARYARDLFRIKAEIIGEQFSIETLRLITGIQLPSHEKKIQAQIVAEQAQQSGQPPPQDVQEVLLIPTWEQVKDVMESDALRSFKVDIETDSTIQADLARAQQNVSGFVEGFAAFTTAMGPAVEAGIVPLDIVADLLTGFARNFKLGKQAEDALERLGQQTQQSQQQGQSDPAAAQAEADQADRAEDFALRRQEMEIKREEMGLKRQERADKANLDQANNAIAAEDRQRDIGLRAKELEYQRARDRLGDIFEERKFAGEQAATAVQDIDDIREGAANVAAAVEQALSVASEALSQIAALRQDLAAPKTIDVQRSNGKIVGGKVSQGDIETQVRLN